MELIYQHFESLVSTNDWAKERLASFPRDKVTVISADTQTKGRGRQGKQWHSPKGENIYASFCFFLAQAEHEPLTLTRLLSLAIAEVLEEYGIHAQLKAPNDLLVNGKKIAGILCETQQIAPYIGVVIGVGLNVNMSEEGFGQVGQPATSMRVESGREVQLEEALKKIGENFALKIPPHSPLS